jgi:hypothetical protein
MTFDTVPHALAVAVVTLTALTLPAATTLAEPAKSAGAAAQSRDCFDELENGTSAEFTCDYPVALAEQERGDLKRITRGYLEDVTCAVNVRIDRGMIERAVQDTDYVFQSPEQPVACDVKTSKSTLHITATFAPRVTFKGGKAVEGTPGLENIQGVTRILSWPVKVYVNRAPHVRNTMLQIVNAYRKYWADKHKAR